MEQEKKSKTKFTSESHACVTSDKNAVKFLMHKTDAQ
jgi:hypothetical protein